MKKYLRYADVLVLFAGSLGLLLRLIVLLGGTDEKGLYPANHPAWVILCIFSAAVIVAIWLLTRQVGTDQRYQKNFPASLVGAVCTALAAIGIAVAAFDSFGSTLLNIIGGLAGILSAAALLWAAYCRYLGKKPSFICHALPAVFFAIRVFLLGQVLGAEPETVRYLFEMLASLALIPASYQLWGFDVGQGNRQKSLFWSLAATYLCIVAIIGQENWLLHLTCTAWLLTNMCSLQHLPKRMRSAEPDVQESARAEAPAEAVTAQDPAPADAATPVDPMADFDADAILAEILREIDKNVE